MLIDHHDRFNAFRNRLSSLERGHLKDGVVGHASGDAQSRPWLSIGNLQPLDLPEAILTGTDGAGECGSSQSGVRRADRAVVRLALVLLYAFAAVAALAPARASWRRRTVTPLAAPLSLILVGVGEWAAAQALAVAVPQPAMQVAFSCAIFPGVSLVVAGFYWQSR